MKKSKQKSKDGRGGARPGAGGGHRWKHGRTKLVRLPVALLDEILEVARYMDQNDGNLPPSEGSLITWGHPAKTLSAEEFKELAAKRKAQELAAKVMAGNERVWVSDATFKELYELPESLWGEP